MGDNVLGFHSRGDRLSMVRNLNVELLHHSDSSLFDMCCLGNCHGLEPEPSIEPSSECGKEDADVCR